MVHVTDPGVSREHSVQFRVSFPIDSSSPHLVSFCTRRKSKRERRLQTGPLARSQLARHLTTLRGRQDSLDLSLGEETI
ncbi:hypothetical protein E4T56_gene9249 [Termitomyces sp. T112]|nr:hypothetical protein E4T56_gene9249 [Termitomyces sp. T112]